MNGSDTEVEFEEKDITVSKSWSPVDVPHFVPSWEGLRGIAVLLTCVSHIDKTGTKFHHYAGSGGVSIFFVLSGFLITGVLVKQQVRYSPSYTEKRKDLPTKHYFNLKFIETISTETKSTHFCSLETILLGSNGTTVSCLYSHGCHHWISVRV